MTTPQHPLDIQTVTLKKAALCFRAVNHKLRQQMLRLMHTEGRMTVTKIYTRLKLEQSIASQQLAILRRANLVTTEKQGKLRYYAVNYQNLAMLHFFANELVKEELLFGYLL